MIHPCTKIYNVAANGKIYGTTKGICRITGKESVGLPFKDWVRNTFTNHDELLPGNIISNEALFCFDESSDIIKAKLNKDKPQRFRTYSHIIDKDNNWHCFTKSDKKQILSLILEGASLVCLTDSGQKHMLFKHRNGTWQLDDLFVMPNPDQLTFLHSIMMELLSLGFSQAEIISGNYNLYRIRKVGVKQWKELEDKLRPHRGSKFFEFTSWLMYTEKSES